MSTAAGATDHAPAAEVAASTPALADVGGGSGGEIVALAGAALARLRADPRLGIARSDDVMALQRTAGNEATRTALADAFPRLLLGGRRPIAQRDPPGATSAPSGQASANPPLTADLIQVPAGEPTPAGQTTVEPSAAIKDAVKVRSGDIRWNVGVSLKPGANLGRGISVGFIQTLQSSERVAVYRKGGTPSGEVVAEKRIRTPKSGDALAEKNPATGEITRAAVHPWYSQPTRLSDSAAGPFAIEFRDRPSFTVDTSFGEGRLTEIRGADSFIVSIAAMDDGSRTPVYVRNASWDLPWAVSVDPSMHGTGEAIRTAPSSEPAEVIDGPIARFSGSESFAFPTVEAAMAAPPFYLLMSLPELLRTDLPGWWIAVEALTRKNPPIDVRVTVEETDATFTSDQVVATAAGHRVATKGGLTLNDHETGTISFRLLDVLMPLIIGADTKVDFEVMSATTPLNLLERNQQPARLSWAFPFGRQRAEEQRAGSGRYTLEVGLGG